MSTWGGFRRRGRTLTAGLLAFWRPGGRDGGCPGTLSPIWADGAVRDSADGGADGNHHHASGAHGGTCRAGCSDCSAPCTPGACLWAWPSLAPGRCGLSLRWIMAGGGAPSSRPRLRWAPTTGCGRCEPIETGPSCLGRPGLYWRTLCFRNRTQAHWGWPAGPSERAAELRDAKPFPADIRGEAADPDSLLMSSFVYRPDREEVRLLAGLSALGEGGPDHPKKKWACHPPRPGRAGASSAGRRRSPWVRG